MMIEFIVYMYYVISLYSLFCVSNLLYVYVHFEQIILL